MFGSNEKVGAKFFEGEPQGTLKVTSIFYTFQGEGPFTGQPAAFVRLTKCNLACTFCDAAFDQGETMTFEKIMERIVNEARSFWINKGKEVPSWAFIDPVDNEDLNDYGFGLVISGGEPSLQKNLVDFLKAYGHKFKWAQTESNGIVTLPLPQDTVSVVSPKCLEKEGVAVRYLKPTDEMLQRADVLKFVMSSDPESPYNTVPQWAHDWAEVTGKAVYVSPMNVYSSLPQKMKLLIGKTDKSLEERSTVDEVVSFWEPGVLDMDANRRNHEHAAQYALEHGFRFQVQTHLLASVA